MFKSSVQQMVWQLPICALILKWIVCFLFPLLLLLLLVFCFCVKIIIFLIRIFQNLKTDNFLFKLRLHSCVGSAFSVAARYAVQSGSRTHFAADRVRQIACLCVKFKSFEVQHRATHAATVLGMNEDIWTHLWVSSFNRFCNCVCWYWYSHIF